MPDPSANLIVALVAIGMGLSFLAADPESPTSRSLALSLGLFGATVVTYVVEDLGTFSPGPRLWPRLHAVTEAGALAAGFEWILRVGRTKETSDPHIQMGEGLLRVAQALAAVHALLGIAFPVLRAELIEPGWQPAVLSRPEFYLFVAPFHVSWALATVRVVQLGRSRLELPEKVRLLAFCAAAPFFASLLVLPSKYGPFVTVAGELIFLAGAVRYHVLQGQRGHFLARFLSPQVARLVHERGLSSAIQQKRVQLSVVACDLRGFTAFAETAAPEEVIQFLREYYQEIGSVVTEHGGTIKDFAGDGILILVGAPIAYPDHARRAVAMALGIRKRGQVVLERWRRLGLELGLGVGVASGFVTVGAIDGAGQLEYAAIGPAVNLAARLCDRAAAGEVMVDQRTVGLVGESAGAWRFDSLEEIELKGFSRPVPVYAAVS